MVWWVLWAMAQFSCHGCHVHNATNNFTFSPEIWEMRSSIHAQFPHVIAFTYGFIFSSTVRLIHVPVLHCFNHRGFIPFLISNKSPFIALLLKIFGYFAAVSIWNLKSVWLQKKLISLFIDITENAYIYLRKLASLQFWVIPPRTCSVSSSGSLILFF